MAKFAHFICNRVIDGDGSLSPEIWVTFNSPETIGFNVQDCNCALGDGVSLVEGQVFVEVRAGGALMDAILMVYTPLGDVATIE